MGFACGFTIGFLTPIVIIFVINIILEKELASFILPVRDYVADSYGGGPNVNKKQCDVCLRCQVSIGESIARLKPKVVKP